MLPFSPALKPRLAAAIALVCFTLLGSLPGVAQIGPRTPSTNSSATYIGAFDQGQVDFWMEAKSLEKRQKALENLSDSVSKLDLKAPGAARREYEKGRQLLAKQSFADAADHLIKAISIYPSFVSAHNSLGSAYLDLGQNERAGKEFEQSVALDDHLPQSFVNLGRAQFALKDFSGAEHSMQKASALSPLDLHMLAALTYAQVMNSNYTGAVATAQQVHERRHQGAAIVHYLAAAALQGQNNLPAAQTQLQTFLAEDPNSFAAAAARQTLEKLTDQINNPAPISPTEVSFSSTPLDPNSRPGLPSAAARVLHQIEQQRQLAEVEAQPESVCESCTTPGSDGLSPNTPSASEAPPTMPPPSRERSSLSKSSPYTLRSTVNEVAVFFAATDHGKSVSDLSLNDVVIRDAGKAPASVVKFRNESQLPLRLGLVIDTSSSVTRQFPFEQKAAAAFLQKSLTDKKDQAFVVGFSSDVLLVQDLSSDDTKISEGIQQLAPSGGTALWDAVKFASDKLGALREDQPVAKILVVISDGDDNSSSATLKEAIDSAERHEVTLYTVSTREFASTDANALIADRAMKALAERTGGAAFFPNSLGDLNHRLADLQEVIRSRYLISYKPSQFQADGSYRTIDVLAHKSGHKLHIYARRGYYAPNSSTTESR
jgi:Ca-activated chloride channel homolog